MKETLKKIGDALGVVFGYGVMACLFVGGLTFFGFIAALIIGGDTATAICAFIYKNLYPVLVLVSTSLVLLSMLKMYLCGQMKEKKKDGGKPAAGQPEGSGAAEGSGKA